MKRNSAAKWRWDDTYEHYECELVRQNTSLLWWKCIIFQATNRVVLKNDHCSVCGLINNAELFVWYHIRQCFSISETNSSFIFTNKAHFSLFPYFRKIVFQLHMEKVAYILFPGYHGDHMAPVLKPRAAASINMYFGMQIYPKMRNGDGTSIPTGSGLAVAWLFLWGKAVFVMKYSAYWS